MSREQPIGALKGAMEVGEARTCDLLEELVPAVEDVLANVHADVYSSLATRKSPHCSYDCLPCAGDV